MLVKGPISTPRFVFLEALVSIGLTSNSLHQFNRVGEPRSIREIGRRDGRYTSSQAMEADVKHASSVWVAIDGDRVYFGLVDGVLGDCSDTSLMTWHKFVITVPGSSHFLDILKKTDCSSCVCSNLVARLFPISWRFHINSISHEVEPTAFVCYDQG